MPMTLQSVLDHINEIVEDYPEMLQSPVEVENENGTIMLANVVSVETNMGHVSLIIEDNET